MAKLVTKGSRFSIMGVMLRIAILVAIILVVNFIWGIVVLSDNIILYSTDVPSDLSGYKIAHISDLLNSNLNYETIINNYNPNMVVISGNIADQYGKYNTSLKKIKELAKKYTVIFVDGDSDNEGVIAALEESGAIYIGSGAYEVSLGEEQPSLKIVGVSEEDMGSNRGKNAVIESLGILGAGDFNVAVVSRTERIKDISGNGLNLILSGNTLGVDHKATGFVSGVYADSSSTIIVNPGIGTENKIVKRSLVRPTVTCIKVTNVYEPQKNPIEKILGMWIKDVDTIFDGQPGPELKRITYVGGEESVEDIENE